jgi:uncharacterized repeat protein (TIGR02543 family)
MALILTVAFYSCVLPRDLFDNIKSTFVVNFDLNYANAGAAPAAQTIIRGDKVVEPTAPTRTSYTFGGWFRESTCATAWAFATDTVASDMTLYAKWTAAPTPGSFDSLEFGHDNGGGGSDHALRSDVPQGGTLFSVWTKLPDPSTWTSPNTWSSSDYSQIRHYNMDVYVLRASNWSMRFIVGNIAGVNATSASYNANSMVFAEPYNIYTGDYSYYQGGGGGDIPISTAIGWVWAAWWVKVNSDSISIEQWLKFGINGPVFVATATGTDVATFADLRASIANNDTTHLWTQPQIDAWVPGDATSFQVGRENGYICHARMDARSAAPTLTELESMASASAPDTTAWADYRLSWTNGAADLSDRSGHGRDLSMETGGILYQGPLSPDFP